MARRTQLQQLLESLPGPPAQVLERVLALAAERLGLDAAVVAAGGRRVAVGADGQPAEVPDAVVAAAAGEVLLPDTAADDGAVGPALARLGVGACAAVPLGDGALVVVGARPARVDDRDLALLRELAEVAAVLLDRAEAPAAGPTLADLDRVAEAVEGARDVDELARPLLDVLHDLTGLGSTYLTTIDEDAGVQRIRTAHNTREGFAIPEGLQVPWGDTLCKRSLDEGRQVTTDVPAVWGDSEAARVLGIQVYASVPVELSDGTVWGTLCAADAQTAPEADRHLPTMRLFARLIASEVEREAALAAERERATRAEAEVLRDPLTGCATRRVVEPWLDAAVGARQRGETLLAAYVDVDAFKAVNDRLGHAAGDAVLAAVGRHLRERSRPGDLVARLGGDEFLLAARVPRRGAERVAERLRRATRLDVAHGEQQVPVTLSVGVVLSDDDDPAAILEAADREMYERKRSARP